MKKPLDGPYYLDKNLFLSLTGQCLCVIKKSLLGFANANMSKLIEVLKGCSHSSSQSFSNSTRGFRLVRSLPLFLVLHYMPMNEITK